jgi:hypothetical protein
MPDWEYLTLVRKRGWNAPKKNEAYCTPTDWVIYAFTASGEMNLDGTNNDIDAILGRIGKGGWELVAISPRSGYLGGKETTYGINAFSDIAGYTSEELWVFKRPAKV